MSRAHLCTTRIRDAFQDLPERSARACVDYTFDPHESKSITRGREEKMLAEAESRGTDVYHFPTSGYGNSVNRYIPNFMVCFFAISEEDILGRFAVAMTLAD